MSPRIVALGGGHGLYATLSAARRLTPHVTAVVTVADDGGSSGRLRSELDIVPPGDLRMALAALASDSPHGQLWATIIQHRFNGNGALAGHPIGNLLLAGLNEVLADPVAALDELGRILGVKGRVLPMCPIALQIEAALGFLGLYFRQPVVDFFQRLTGQNLWDPTVRFLTELPSRRIDTR